MTSFENVSGKPWISLVKSMVVFESSNARLRNPAIEEAIDKISVIVRARGYNLFTINSSKYRSAKEFRILI